MRGRSAYLALGALLAGVGVLLLRRELGEVLRDASDISLTGFLRATSQFGSARRGDGHGDAR